jgi:tetratricopeptide (TPR) repeat protein
VSRRRGSPARRAAGDTFFDSFRSAAARLPAGLVRLMPAASDDDIRRAEAALGRALPGAYASFLRSFDGADLFHESVILAGVGPHAARSLVDLNAGASASALSFAESLVGDVFQLDDAERVLRYDPGTEERALAGSSFARWLDATVASERLLFDADGEYAPDVFDASGEVVPAIALRQAERALRADPGSADSAHARGLALARLGRRKDALVALRAAAELAPDSPWVWFDLGRTALDARDPTLALTAFRHAAAVEPEDTRARVLAWAARAAVAAGDDAAAEAARAEALAREPALVEELERAAHASAQDGDAAAEAEALALREAIAPGRPIPKRLTVL